MTQTKEQIILMAAIAGALITAAAIFLFRYDEVLSKESAAIDRALEAQAIGVEVVQAYLDSPYANARVTKEKILVAKASEIEAKGSITVPTELTLEKGVLNMVGTRFSLVR